MIELRQFKFSLARQQCRPFDFEHASVALLARHKYSKTSVATVSSARERKNLPTLPGVCVVGKGCTHHG